MDADDGSIDDNNIWMMMMIERIWWLIDDYDQSIMVIDYDLLRMIINQWCCVIDKIFTKNYF